MGLDDEDECVVAEDIVENPAHAKEDVVKPVPVRVAVKSVEHKAGPLLKITFISGDTDEDAYNGYFATHPWTSDGYDKEKEQKLSDEYGVTGIPTLIVLNKDGKTVATNDARMDVSKLGPLECMQKWIGLIK